MDKTRPKRRKPDEMAQVVAYITGVTPRYVSMVRKGNRNNEDVMANLVDLGHAKKIMIENFKKKQELYRRAVASDHEYLIIELEEELDELQETYQNIFSAKLENFAHKICA